MSHWLTMMSLENLEKYEQLTLEALQEKPEADIIIWPEGSASH
jgi:apolipoprotein N-acyltransferase